MIEQALEQIIRTTSTVCSTVSQNSWLVDLDLNCSFSTEVLVGVLVLPVALLLAALDVLFASRRARARSRAFARRLEEINGQDLCRAQAQRARGAIQHDRKAGDTRGEEICLAPPVFEPARAMKWA